MPNMTYEINLGGNAEEKIQSLLTAFERINEVSKSISIDIKTPADAISKLVDSLKEAVVIKFTADISAVTSALEGLRNTSIPIKLEPIQQKISAEVSGISQTAQVVKNAVGEKSSTTAINTTAAIKTEESAKQLSSAIGKMQNAATATEKGQKVQQPMQQVYAQKIDASGLHEIFQKTSSQSLSQNVPAARTIAEELKTKGVSVTERQVERVLKETAFGKTSFGEYIARLPSISASDANRDAVRLSDSFNRALNSTQKTAQEVTQTAKPVATEKQPAVDKSQTVQVVKQPAVDKPQVISQTTQQKINVETFSKSLRSAFGEKDAEVAVQKITDSLSKEGFAVSPEQVRGFLSEKAYGKGKTVVGSYLSDYAQSDASFEKNAKRLLTKFNEALPSAAISQTQLQETAKEVKSAGREVVKTQDVVKQSDVQRKTESSKLSAKVSSDVIKSISETVGVSKELLSGKTPSALREVVREFAEKTIATSSESLSRKQAEKFISPLNQEMGKIGASQIKVKDVFSPALANATLLMQATVPEQEPTRELLLENFSKALKSPYNPNLTVPNNQYREKLVNMLREAPYPETAKKWSKYVNEFMSVMYEPLIQESEFLSTGAKSATIKKQENVAKLYQKPTEYMTEWGEAIEFAPGTRAYLNKPKKIKPHELVTSSAQQFDNELSTYAVAPKEKHEVKSEARSYVVPRVVGGEHPLKSFTVLDVESVVNPPTAPDVVKSGVKEILQYSASTYQEGKTVVGSNVHIQPHHAFQQQEAVHGSTFQHIKSFQELKDTGAQKFHEALPEIVGSMTSGVPIIGHNVHTDFEKIFDEVKFAEEQYLKAPKTPESITGLKAIETLRKSPIQFFDTMRFVAPSTESNVGGLDLRNMLQLPNSKLEDLAPALGFKYNAGRAHDASWDIQATAYVASVTAPLYSLKQRGQISDAEVQYALESQINYQKSREYNPQEGVTYTSDYMAIVRNAAARTPKETNPQTTFADFSAQNAGGLVVQREIQTKLNVSVDDSRAKAAKAELSRDMRAQVNVQVTDKGGATSNQYLGRLSSERIAREAQSINLSSDAYGNEMSAAKQRTVIRQMQQQSLGQSQLIFGAETREMVTPRKVSVQDYETLKPVSYTLEGANAEILASKEKMASIQTEIEKYPGRTGLIDQLRTATLKSETAHAAKKIIETPFQSESYTDMWRAYQKMSPDEMQKFRSTPEFTRFESYAKQAQESWESAGTTKTTYKRGVAYQEKTKPVYERGAVRMLRMSDEQEQMVTSEWQKAPEIVRAEYMRAGQAYASELISKLPENVQKKLSGATFFGRLKNNLLTQPQTSGLEQLYEQVSTQQAQTAYYTAQQGVNIPPPTIRQPQQPDFFGKVKKFFSSSDISQSSIFTASLASRALTSLATQFQEAYAPAEQLYWSVSPAFQKSRVVGEMTEASFGGFMEDIKTIAPTTMLPLQTLGEMSYVFVNRGYATEQSIPKVLTNLSAASRIAGEDATVMGQSIMSLMQAWNPLSMEQLMTQTPDLVARFADLQSYALSESPMEAKWFKDIANYAAPTFAALGFSPEDTMGTFMAMSQTMPTAGIAARSSRMLLYNMFDPEKLQAISQESGIDFSEISSEVLQKGGSLADALGVLAKKIESLPVAERLSIERQLGGGVRGATGLQAMLPVAENIKQFTTDLAEKSVGYTAKITREESITPLGVARAAESRKEIMQYEIGEKYAEVRSARTDLETSWMSFLKASNPVTYAATSGLVEGFKTVGGMTGSLADLGMVGVALNSMKAQRTATGALTTGASLATFASKAFLPLAVGIMAYEAAATTGSYLSQQRTTSETKELYSRLFTNAAGESVSYAPEKVLFGKVDWNETTFPNTLFGPARGNVPDWVANIGGAIHSAFGVQPTVNFQGNEVRIETAKQLVESAVTDSKQLKRIELQRSVSLLSEEDTSGITAAQSKISAFDFVSGLPAGATKQALFSSIGAFTSEDLAEAKKNKPQEEYDTFLKGVLHEERGGVKTAVSAYQEIGDISKDLTKILGVDKMPDLASFYANKDEFKKSWDAPVDWIKTVTGSTKKIGGEEFVAARVGVTKIAAAVEKLIDGIASELENISINTSALSSKSIGMQGNALTDRQLQNWMDGMYGDKNTFRNATNWGLEQVTTQEVERDEFGQATGIKTNRKFSLLDFGSNFYSEQTNTQNKSIPAETWQKLFSPVNPPSSEPVASMDQKMLERYRIMDPMLYALSLANSVNMTGVV